MLLWFTDLMNVTEDYFMANRVVRIESEVFVSRCGKVYGRHLSLKYPEPLRTHLKNKRGQMSILFTRKGELDRRLY